MNFNLSFLDKIEKLKDKKIDILQSENNFYRGAIPWFLLCSEKKKIIYISTSNRNLEIIMQCWKITMKCQKNKKIF